jgi:hypothetical protein
MIMRKSDRAMAPSNCSLPAAAADSPVKGTAVSTALISKAGDPTMENAVELVGTNGNKGAPHAWRKLLQPVQQRQPVCHHPWTGIKSVSKVLCYNDQSSPTSGLRSSVFPRTGLKAVAAINPSSCCTISSLCHSRRMAGWHEEHS